MAFGWNQTPPTWHVVSYKQLRDKELHTFHRMVGYCIKDNGKDHIEFVQHNVFADDMNELKMKYMNFGKVGLKNGVRLP